MKHSKYGRLVKASAGTLAGLYSKFKRSKSKSIGTKVPKRYGAKRKRTGKTRTKRGKKLRLKVAADDINSGVTVTYGTFVVNKKKHNTIGPGVNYRYTRSMLLSGSSGLQLIQDAFSMATVSQWKTSVAYVAGVPPAVDVSNVRYFDFNPAQKLSGSAFITGAVPANDRLVFEKSEVMYDLANLANTPCVVRMYVFKCMHDCNDGPSQYFQNCLAAQQMGVANQAAPAAGTVGSAIGTTIQTFPYVTPEELPGFSKVWKKVYRTDFELATGAYRKIYLHGIHNDLGRQEEIGELGTNYRKGTVYTWFQVLGAPVVDKTGGAYKDVTLSPGYVGVYATHNLTFRAVKAGPQRLRGDYAQLNTTTGAAIADLKFMGYGQTEIQVSETV